MRALMQSRDAKRMPPRVANGPTLLAGVIRCGCCGAAMIQNTGKGGTYRYYCRSRKLKEEITTCRGIRMPMGRLDDIVVGEVAKRVLEPKRLGEMLEAYVRLGAERQTGCRDRLSKLRQGHKDAEAAIARLLELVEKGLMDAEDPSLRERLIGLKVRRDELAKEAADLRRRLASGEPQITRDKVDRLTRLLRDKLYDGPAELRQAYARLVMDEVTVTDDEIRISGSKGVLARRASQAELPAAPAVLSFVQEWRATQDKTANTYVIEIPA